MDPVTREERMLNNIAQGTVSEDTPITREEMYLAYISGMDIVPPEPITRKEKFLSRIVPNGGTGVTIKNQNKTITENGTYKADSGYTGLGTVTVNVPEPVLESLTATQNGNFTPPVGVDGFGAVTVNVPIPEPVLEALTITENGEYTPSAGVDGFSKVVANIAASGGSMESGELTTTSANYWVFTIPVSSKKTHLLVLPKSFSNMWSQDTAARERLLVAVEGIGHIQGTPGSQTDETAIANGASRWYFAGDPSNKVVFNSDSIEFEPRYSPWAIGEYLWFAW